MKSKHTRYYITSRRSITIYCVYEGGNKRRTPVGNPTGVSKIEDIILGLSQIVIRNKLIKDSTKNQ